MLLDFSEEIRGALVRRQGLHIVEVASEQVEMHSDFPLVRLAATADVAATDDATNADATTAVCDASRDDVHDAT